MGGALVGWIGASWAFGLAASLSLGAVIILSKLREPDRDRADSRDLVRNIKEGAAFVFRHALLFLTQFTFNVGFFVLYAAYVPHALRWLHLSPSEVGATLGIHGIGMVVGALGAARIMRALRFGVVVAVGPLAGLAGAALMLLTVWAPSALLAGSSFFLLGAGPILWVISTTTLRQTVTPPQLLGRVSAINLVAYGARPIGAAIAAIVGGLYSAQLCLVVATFVFAIKAVVIVLSPLPWLDRQPAAIGA